MGLNKQHWAVIAACLMLTFSAGPFFILTVFFTSFEAEFGWSRALTSSIHSVFLVVAAFSNILVGWLTDRYGPRLPIVVSAIFLGLGIALLSQTHSIGQFLLLYAVASIGAGAQYVVPAATVQRLIPPQRVGLALGIVMAGMPAAKLIYSPAAGFLLPAIGWRSSYIVFGATVFLLLIVGALLIPARDKMRTMQGDAARGEPSSARSQQGDLQERLSLGQIMKTRTFLIAAVLFMFPIVPIHMVQVHIVPFAEGVGINRTDGAVAAGFIGAFGIAGTIGWPLLFSGKLSWRWSVFATALACSLMMLWLVVTRNLLMLYVFVLLFGFFYYSNSPSRLALLKDLFGSRFLASVTGILAAIGSLIGAGGPIIAGYIHDKTGSYSIAFLIGAAFWLMMALVSVLLKKPASNAAPVKSAGHQPVSE